MPPKGGNAKKESGRAKKAENEAKKQEAAAAEKERKEAEKWVDKDVKGGKAKQEEKEEKRKAELARKAENARLLAEEEKAAASSKPKAASGPKKKAAATPKPAGPGAIAAGGGLGGPSNPKAKEPTPEVESYAATGIDNALDLLEVVTAKMDKASVGQQAAGIERHPERRFKAAFEAYQEREMPRVKEENPGLRLQQYKDLLYKQFQKSPDNPFNQVTIEYNATKDDKVEALKAKQAQIEQRLREHK
ncbi:Coiled-coil domain-containing protein 124-like protein [Psilocybe cubensis]|uniref:DUF1014-domain-containing protein n=2 Tax=Psilocybe cubensis TaxID=181762 RepID=A0A8H7Y4B8_PSICU|nr:Coiled-coil domain-containing protein 124-like protein [Psilocybe cubensis]KAH9483641.1 Coiled-coil domain-containing protein 124-like protein [Psilocybe cubensis]